MKKLKALIVDDEPLARDNIKTLLKQDEDFDSIAECRNGAEAISILKKQFFDLLFLDIQMPGKSGLEVAATLDKQSCPFIIFVTAYDKYALEAFKIHALDYLLKPFNDEEFFDSVQRAKNFILLKNINEYSSQLNEFINHYKKTNTTISEMHPEENVHKKYSSRISVPLKNKIILVETEDIDWIEAADYYCKLHCGRNIYLLRETLNNLERNLDPEKFIRIHRSTIVNVLRIKELESYYNNEYIAILKDGTKLKISKNQKDKLKKALAYCTF